MYRRVGLLDRFGIAVDFGKFDELARKARFVFGPQFPRGLEVLDRLRPSALEVAAHDFGFLGKPSTAHAKYKTAAGVIIDAGHFLGHQDRMAFRNQADAGADLDGSGDSRGDGQSDEGIGKPLVALRYITAGGKRRHMLNGDNGMLADKGRFVTQ